MEESRVHVNQKWRFEDRFSQPDQFLLFCVKEHMVSYARIRITSFRVTTGNKIQTTTQKQVSYVWWCYSYQALIG